MKTQIMIAIMGLSAICRADQAGYQIDVQRSEGDVACAVTSGDEVSVNCETNVRSKKHILIAMNPNPKGEGFIGVDKVTDDKTTPPTKYVLVAVADQNKQLKNIVLVRSMGSSENTFDGSMSISAASSLTAMTIDPIHVEKKDDQNASVRLSFLAYGQADASDNKDTVESQVQPLVEQLF